MNWSEEEILEGVLETFRALAERPHGSGHEAAQCAYMTQRLRALGAAVETDEAGNLLAELPATPGRSHLPLAVVQGHLDMVCAVLPGSGFDPLRDPVTVQVENGVLKSDGRSSLGADNNLGNAALLWLLEQGTPHGPLRVLFTVQEEVGLVGAKQVDKRWLDGAEYLLNTDGFQGGAVVVSSASGVRENWTHPLATQPGTKRHAFRLTLEGFRGGHSGFDIDKGRANPIQLLSRLLNETSVEVAELTGGHSFNAIPMSASAWVTADDPERLQSFAHREAELWKTWYRETDPEGRLTVEPAPLPQRVWSGADQRAVLDFLSRLVIGPTAMREDMADRVMTSANLGQVWADGEGVHAAAFIRSSDLAQEHALSHAHDALAQEDRFTGTVERYPGWPGGRDNRLAQAMSRLYEARNGCPLEIEALHVGLEPSIFLEKAPALTMVSFGATILDPHSISERVPLSSVPPFVRLLADTLASFS